MKQVFYNAVIRGDNGKVVIGSNTNVQDRAVITTIGVASTNVFIGSNVTIGHGAIINGSTVADNVLIGQGSVLEEGSNVGKNSIIAAGAVVLPGTAVPEGQLWAGNPAQFVRNLKNEELGYLGKVRPIP